MENKQIADVLSEIADILDILGENSFRIRSYRSASRTIEDAPVRIYDLIKDGASIEGLPGIGKAISGKVEEIVNTGTCKKREELREQVPCKVSELLKIEGLGPKKVKLLYEQMNVDSVDSLEKLIKDGKIHELDGMGEKTEEKLLRSIQYYRSGQGQFKISTGLSYAIAFSNYISSKDEVVKIEPAGSLRRRKETIGDLDLLVTCLKGSEKIVMDHFTSYPETVEVFAHGETKSSIKLSCGLQVDLRVIEEESFGAALQYFTGSQAHNIALRRLASEKGMKINEYGVFDQNENFIAGRTEEDVYNAVQLEWIPPEMRENRGEIALAANRAIPQLIRIEDIRGDLQMHTQFSDGKDTETDMAKKALELGYEYIAITNHSKAVRVAGGMNETELLESFNEIDKAQKEVPGIRILKGIEVDILSDGSLDLSEDTLKQCDVVVAAIHSGFNMNEDDMTERIIRGISQKTVNIFAHPTGRLIQERPAYSVDLSSVFRTAKEHNVLMEINAYPDRLDLNDINARIAKEMGLKFVISSDAHAGFQLEVMKYGIFTARRAWLEPIDVINTFSADEFLDYLKK
ncbi:MAG: DNA polymerase/3'-5' exonuclease PolX [Candidatus Theseobacter exili]|nr:DNA polymerase/3'-5' exonuclease PolX [Candidatus Theseobacter exili]